MGFKQFANPFKTPQDAYAAGRACGLEGATLTNCHFTYFATPELTKEWERGKKDGEQLREQREYDNDRD